ncbi:MAG: hypothetical protein ACP5C3_04125 [Methanomicrobiales archaeon]
MYMAIILVIISGLGITYFRTFEFLTLGILEKSTAFRIHEILFPILVVLLIIHTFMPTIIKKQIKLLKDK